MPLQIDHAERRIDLASLAAGSGPDPGLRRAVAEVMSADGLRIFWNRDEGLVGHRLERDEVIPRLGQAIAEYDEPDEIAGERFGRKRQNE